MLDNFFETMRDIQENFLEWDPQLPRPAADSPFEDFRQYDKDVIVAVDVNFLNHMYGIEEPVEQPIVAEEEQEAPNLPEEPKKEIISPASEPVENDEESARTISLAEARAKRDQAIANHPPTEPTSYDLPKSA